MFRLSRYLRAIESDAAASRRAPAAAAPVVIWNLIRRCNLACKHCYATSADHHFDGELTTAEIFAVMDDLHACGVRVLILSGGEPMLHPDLYEIAARARAMGFYVGLSTNGTLIDEDNIDRLAALDLDYVGISLDGMREIHDRFRRRTGAFDESLRGIRLCRAAGLRVGLRFTLTADNHAELPALLDLMHAEDVDKFYLSHLNYAGRGNRNRTDASFGAMTRRAIDLLIEACLNDIRAGRHSDYVTGNNDADGVYLLHWVRRHRPGAAARLEQMLLHWGGNASGTGIANIDNLGNVHPDTMWWDYTLGNVRERPFPEIFDDETDPLLRGLRERPRPVEGRCGSCRYLAICGGNSRTRAWQLTGNPWAEDPGCYLDDDEIGVVDMPPRRLVTPWSRWRGRGIVAQTAR